MKTIKSTLKSRFAKAFSLIMVMVLFMGAGTANGATAVSGAAIPPSPSNKYNASVKIFLNSFQSGSWKYDEDKSPVSPAWKKFSSKLRYDYQGVIPGDYQKTFDDILTPAGLSMDICKKSSVIWMTRDISGGGYTINKHSNWMEGASLTGNSAAIAAALTKAPVKDTQKSANLSAIAKEVSKNSAITTMIMPEMKVICSAQFTEEAEKVSGKEPVKECVGKECDPAEEPKETPAAKGGFCTPGEENVWRGRGKPGSSMILQKADELQLALALGEYDGLSAIHALLQGIGQEAAGSQNGMNFENSYRWKCQTRYMSYYQSAPATYHTRTTLANIKNDETGQIGNVFDLMQKRNNQNFKTNSTAGKAWYDGMKLVSGLNDVVEVGGYLSEALSVESGLTKTGYADKWNQLNKSSSLKSKAEFSEFYKVNDSITKIVKADEKNKNFSSGTGLPATQQAILATGGVLNVEERERQKVVRVVQPYVDIEIRKCVDRKAIIVNLFPCTPSISGSRSYQNEKPNTKTTNANEIMIDQAQHAINRSANIIADGAKNPMTATSGIMAGANMVVGNMADDLSYCAESAQARIALLFPSFEGFLGSFGELAGMIANISDFVNTVNNVTIDCTDAVENANPPTIDKLGEIALNTASFSAFIFNPQRGVTHTTHLSFVPKKANMIVQKAQYDPETVSWWQVLSVNCNLAGFEMARASVPGTRMISDRFKVEDEYISTGVGRNMHAVARSPIVHVEPTDDSTRFTPTNYMFARPGTPSSMLSFYDKECGFRCVNDNDTAAGASKENDAVGNSPSDLKYRIDANKVSNKFGAQMKDENNSETYKEDGGLAGERFINTNFFNIFRDNEERRIRVDTWYPANVLGTANSYIDELKNIVNNSNNGIEGIQALITYANNLIDNAANTGNTIGLLYDGSAASSTTVTRYQKGTPAIKEFFNIYAIGDTGGDKGVKYGEQSLDASKGEQGKQLFIENSAGIPIQRAHSQDLGTGNKTVEILDGFYNNFDVKSKWASDKSLPHVFNIKWEYQSASVFPSISAAGFKRIDGTKDKNVGATSGVGATLTFLEGKCYAMFGTELSKRTTDMFQANTGTGVPNKLDNNSSGLASQSPNMGKSNEENLYVNSLRSTTE